MTLLRKYINNTVLTGIVSFSLHSNFIIIQLMQYKQYK